MNSENRFYDKMWWGTIRKLVRREAGLNVELNAASLL